MWWIEVNYVVYWGGVLSSTVAERAQIEIVGHGLGTADSLSSLPHFHL